MQNYTKFGWFLTQIYAELYQILVIFTMVPDLVDLFLPDLVPFLKYQIW